MRIAESGVKLHRLKRLKIIVDVLNQHVNHPILRQEIIDLINVRLDVPTGKHQLDKDLQSLKWDFDLEIEYHARHGVCLKEPFSFMKALEDFLK